MVHSNGMASFWAVLRRAYVCIYHHMNAKHLHRYVGEFTGRHNTRPMDPEAQVALTVRNDDGKRLRFVNLIMPKHTRQPAKSAYYLISKSYIASEELLG